MWYMSCNLRAGMVQWVPINPATCIYCHLYGWQYYETVDGFGYHDACEFCFLVHKHVRVAARCR